MKRFDVHASYQNDGKFQLDAPAEKVAGRPTDFSGQWLDSDQRDIGWECETKAEAQKIKKALRSLGINAKIQTVTSEVGTPA
jgi:uncharacterized lipoprotein YddW (UPF0748 family)